MIDKNYDEFLETTGASRNLVEDINNFLLDSNCKREIKTAKAVLLFPIFFRDTKKDISYFRLQKKRE